MTSEKLRPRHTMRQIAAIRRLVCTATATSRCDKTLVLGTHANLEEGKCELQPWANCVGKWQKHELITIVPIE